MKHKRAEQIVDQIRYGIKKEGFIPENIVELLKELREVSKELNDPLVTKTLRFVYEYIEDNGTFPLTFEEDQTQTEAFDYFILLIFNSENKFNREEIREVKEFFMEQREEL